MWWPDYWKSGISSLGREIKVGMSVFQAIVLGVIQGIAEFLPISSSGHLVLAQKLMNLAVPPVSFDIMLHVATLGAISWWLKKDLTWSWETVKLVVIGSIPAGVVGLLVEPYLDKLFDSVMIVGGGLIITGVILVMTKRWIGGDRSVDYKRALLIGVAQAVAILPGISRSGSTIAAALMLGVGRQEAMKFSLLLAVPAIAGAQVLEIDNLLKSGNSWPVNLVGFGVAFMVGLVALRLLSGALREKKFHYFGWYCLGAGIMTLLALSLGGK